MPRQRCSDAERCVLSRVCSWHSSMQITSLVGLGHAVVVVISTLNLLNFLSSPYLK